MKTKRFEPGEWVRLTGAFLRNTGQIAGGEGASVWTIVSCSCGLCRMPGNRFVAVNEPSTENPNRPRHILGANLQKVRKTSERNRS